jgi:hypothetical protein
VRARAGVRPAGSEEAGAWREGDRTRGVGAEEGFAGLLGRRHGEEGEEVRVGEAVAAAEGHHLPRCGGHVLAARCGRVSVGRGGFWVKESELGSLGVGFRVFLPTVRVKPPALTVY